MKNIPIGKSELLRDGMDVTLIGFGASVIECVKASELLLLEGVEARVINARFAKPLDQDMILAAARETGGIITAEENVRAGGFGEAVLALLADHKAPEALLLNLTMPDDIVDHGPQKVYRGVYDLDGEGIARQAMKVLLDRRPERKGSLAPA
tara:strand:- start:2147 stop:2602 length:456 start_codon:yes stop_codon:yes gene_type:complete